MQMNQTDGGAVSQNLRSVADVLRPTADLLYARWRRAVDLLWREALRRRQRHLTERERALAARRIRNLQRIVRRALAEYHRIELERSGRRPR
jgi:hypothetical protein